MARTVANQTVINNAIAAPNIDEFRRAMDPTAVGGSGMGFHSGSHIMCGGHMQELFIAPADPVFWCVHAELDRVWTQWQARNPKERIFGHDAISGPRTLLDVPDTRNVTMHDMLNFGRLTPLGRDRRLRELMDPSASWMAYKYV